LEGIGRYHTLQYISLSVFIKIYWKYDITIDSTKYIHTNTNKKLYKDKSQAKILRATLQAAVIKLY
jgi:hypothetical protein